MKFKKNLQEKQALQTIGQKRNLKQIITLNEDDTGSDLQRISTLKSINSNSNKKQQQYEVRLFLPSLKKSRNEKLQPGIKLLSQQASQQNQYNTIQESNLMKHFFDTYQGTDLNNASKQSENSRGKLNIPSTTNKLQIRKLNLSSTTSTSPSNQSKLKSLIQKIDKKKKDQDLKEQRSLYIPNSMEYTKDSLKHNLTLQVDNCNRSKDSIYAIDENQEIIQNIDKRVHKLNPLNHTPQIKAFNDNTSSMQKLKDGYDFNYRDFLSELVTFNRKETVISQNHRFDLDKNNFNNQNSQLDVQRATTQEIHSNKNLLNVKEPYINQESVLQQPFNIEIINLEQSNGNNQQLDIDFYEDYIIEQQPLTLSTVSFQHKTPSHYHQSGRNAPKRSISQQKPFELTIVPNNQVKATLNSNRQGSEITHAKRKSFLPLNSPKGLFNFEILAQTPKVSNLKKSKHPIELSIRLIRVLQNSQRNKELLNSLEQSLLSYCLNHFYKFQFFTKKNLKQSLHSQNHIAASYLHQKSYQKSFQEVINSIEIDGQDEFERQQSNQVDLQQASQQEEEYQELPQKQEVMGMVGNYLINFAIQSLYKLKVKMIFSNKEGITHYALEIFREMARCNYQNILTKLIKKKMINLSLEKYQEFLKITKRQIIIEKVLENTIIPNEKISTRNSTRNQLPPRPSLKKDNYNSATQLLTVDEKKSIDGISPINNQVNRESQIEMDNAIKVAQAFLIEFDSDACRDSTREGNDRDHHPSNQHDDHLSSDGISSINRNLQMPRASNGSQASSTNFIDSLVSSLYKIRELERASIPEIREIERNLLMKMQTLKGKDNNLKINDNFETSQQNQRQSNISSQRLGEFRNQKNLKVDITRTRNDDEEDHKIVETQEISSPLKANDSPILNPTVINYQFCGEQSSCSSASQSHSSFYESEEKDDRKKHSSKRQQQQQQKSHSKIKIVPTDFGKTPIIKNNISYKINESSIKPAEESFIQKPYLHSMNTQKSQLIGKPQQLSHSATRKSEAINNASLPQTRMSVKNNAPSVMKSKLSKQVFGVSVNKTAGESNSKLQTYSHNVTSDKDRSNIHDKSKTSDTAKLLKVFKDLDISRQKLILQALEPHLIKSNKHSKSNKKKNSHKIPMKKYSDFLNHRFEQQ